MYRFIILSNVYLTFIFVTLFPYYAATSVPHIVFILADDLGWNDVGFHGSKEIFTPNLDTLAYSGIMLTNYYLQPICTPTRGALLTGRHPIHLGLQHSVIHTPEPYGLGLNEKLLPEYLKDLGYRNHIIGKWHLGFFTKEYTPTFRGFDTHFGYYSGRQDYWDHTINEVGWGLDFRKNMEMVKTDFGQYGTDVFTREAVKIIEQHNSTEPMFMFISHLAVHTGNSWQPLQAPWEYYQRYPHIKDDRRRTYAAMVSSLDDSVGEILEALANKGILDNTVIVFSTDNGGASNDFQQGAGNNLPLRGLKETYWEGGMRGPGFIWSPHLKQAAYKNNNLMQVTDWLPTLLHVAGYDMSQLPTNIDGVDQWEALSNNQPPVRHEILHNIEPEKNGWAIRKGHMKLVFAERGYTQIFPLWYGPHGPEEAEYYNISSFMSDNILSDSICGEYNRNHCKVKRILKDIDIHLKNNDPFIVDCGPKPEGYQTNCNVSVEPCLYNITADPCEYNNLASAMPDVVEELMSILKLYNETSVPIRNKPMDRDSFPSNHGGFWEPWVEVVPTSSSYTISNNCFMMFLCLYMLSECCSSQ